VLRKFLLWLAPVFVLLAVPSLLKGNVGWLTWIIFAWFVVGAAWQIIRARKPRPTDAVSISPTVPLEEGKQFDPDFCGRVVRTAAICFVLMIVLEFLFFLTVKSAKCPGWQAPMEKQSGGVWAILLFATIWTLHIAYRAVTWRQLSCRVLDQIEWARQTYVPGTNPTWLTDRTQFKAMCTVKNDINTIMVLVLIGSGVFVALPVLTRIGCF
jgi:hypothetical protein